MRRLNGTTIHVKENLMNGRNTGVHLYQNVFLVTIHALKLS